MLGNILFGVMILPSKILNFITVKRKNVSIGTNSLFQGRVSIYGNGKIIIGNNTRINSCEAANPIGGSSHVILSTHDLKAFIKIGNNVGISNSCLVAFDSITIGNNVKIGGNCKIYDSDFHSIDYFERRNYESDLPKTAPVIIKDDAFIGAHSIILKGVTIGEKSIVGAGSVVVKDVPSGEIWAGNPASFVRKIG